jgi:hypothetical protein
VSAPLRVAQRFADEPGEARPVGEGDNEGSGEKAQFRDVRHFRLSPKIRVGQPNGFGGKPHVDLAWIVLGLIAGFIPV